MIIQIPFQGFYESWYSDALNQEETGYLECYCEANNVSDEVKDKLADRIYTYCDYRAMRLVVCEKYVESFENWINEKCELSISLKFESMSSPREYNFSTDRIFCHISEEDVQALRDCLSYEELRAEIKKRFTSYDGFISFYSNNIEEWVSKPLTEWDHNELGTLLTALVTEDLDYQLCDDMNEDFHTAFDKGFDYQKFEQKAKELQLVEAGECEDDFKVFPLGITDTQTYVETYVKMNGLT